MPSEQYWKFWGKAGADAESHHPLVYHCLDVAAVASRLLERSPLLRERVADVLGVEADAAVPLIVWLTALHDTGKFSGSFQQLVPQVAKALGWSGDESAYDTRHDALGAVAWSLFLLTDLLDSAGAVLDKRARRSLRFAFAPLIDAVMGHHGQPIEPEDVQRAKARDKFSDDERAAAMAFSRDVAGLLDLNQSLSQIASLDRKKSRHASWLLAGLLVLADWLGSNSTFFPFKPTPMALDHYWQRALEQADKALEVSGVLVPEPSADEGIGGLFPHFAEPSPVQQRASQLPLSDSGQLFIIEDATGSGKTEAALVLAHRLMRAGLGESIYIGLPTMATAGAMYLRMAEAYGRLFADGSTATLVLAHSRQKQDQLFKDSIERWSSNLASYGSGLETAEAQCSSWLADSRKRALMGSVGVGTIDQALLGVLPSRHQALRLLGILRGVLIVDEVHAYDPYMRELLEGLLEFQGALGGSAILLSATLPANQRQSYLESFARGRGEVDEVSIERSEFPLVTGLGSSVEEWPCQSRAGTEREVGVRLTDSLEDGLEHLVSVAQQGGCAVWIRNTVVDAIEGADQLRQRTSTPVTLFHARYAMCDRLEIERSVLERFGKKSTREQRAGQIVVATQVVEQSLDIDFDAMVTDLAPIDLVVQRAGRLQRHDRGEERGEPELVVLAPPLDGPIEASWYSAVFPRAYRVYPNAGQLWRTATVLAELKRIAIPVEARRLIESVYGEGAPQIPEALLEATSRAERRDRTEAATGAQGRLQVSTGYKKADGWVADTRAVTRLGIPTTTLRLARQDDQGRLLPWADDDLAAWQLSEVSVPFYVAVDSALTDVQKRAHPPMSDRGKWSVTVLLEPLDLGSGVWVGHAINQKGEAVRLSYSEQRGLSWQS